MPLSPGTRLGAYEIVSLLGAGGMGEVYRARDPRLKREIALKVLPDVAAADVDRRERFMREALAVAALNHAHIVTIHSVEDAGTTVFLTMELVEGRTLAAALPADGLPLERVLTIGIAVADAVSAAHQKGITHRDLKPGNIMLGEGEHAGRIKVLDFGLAKIEAQLDMASMLPTAHTAPITAEGRILGTVAYMSPEQAEGRAIDGRSDLFSLGVVLYEMATGHRPFTGDTNLSILSSILKDTPPLVTDINPALPHDLGRIIRRALAKDPERRYQSAKDLRNDLEDLKESLAMAGMRPESVASRDPASSSPSLSSVTAASPAPSSDAQVLLALARRNRRRLAIAAVVLLVGVVAVLYAMRGRDVAPSQASEQTSLANSESTLLTTSGVADRPAISSDGKWIAYVQHDSEGDSLWLRQTTTTSSRRIVAPERGVVLSGATFTPDGTAVDFVRGVTAAADTVRQIFAEIWRVGFLGDTPPRLLISDVSSSISWAPDDQRIAFLRSRLTSSISTKLIVANADGGGERELARGEGQVVWPSLLAPWRPNLPPAWSLDGQLIAVVGVDIAKSEGQVIFVNSVTGSAERVVVPGLGITEGLTWLDAQSLVVNQPFQFGVSHQLFRLSYPAGSLSRLTNDPNDYVGLSLTGDRRSLVTARRETRMDIWVGDSAGSAGADIARRVPVPGDLARLAWAGDRLLYGTVAGGKHAIVRHTPGESAAEELVFDAQSPAARTDGGGIVFVSTSPESPLNLFAADAAGRRTTPLGSASLDQLAVTPDNGSVLFSSTSGGTLSIQIVPIGGGTPTKLAEGNRVAVSPGGEAIVFIGGPAGKGENRAALVVCSLPGCTSQRTVGSVGLDSPIAWTPDGRGIAYASQGNIWMQPLDGSAPSQHTRFTDTRPIGSFAWSRDGSKRLAIARMTVTNDIVLFRNLK